MATSYTSLLGLALPLTGELSGTWGDTVNDSITSLLDTAVAGTTTLSTDGDVTLTTTTGASNQARQAILLCSGARTALRTITAPAQSKIYTVINATTGGFSVKVVGAGPTTGVTIVAGESAVIAWNGSDFIKISNTGGSASFTNVTVSGTTTLSGLTASTALALNSSKEVVSVTNTGTGNNVLSASPTLTGTIGGASMTLSSLTSGRVTYAGASGLLQDNANLTFDGTTLTANALTVSNAVTLSGGTANGVAYLNGSKVLTSGSALTFNGQNLGVDADSAFGSSYITLSTRSRFGYDGNNVVVSDAGTNKDITFLINTAEQMRLTSTGLGIGTNSPSRKLSVTGTGNDTTSGSIITTNANAGTNTQTGLFASNGTQSAQFSLGGTGYSGYGAYAAGNAVIYNNQAITLMADNGSTGVIKFATGGNSEKMRIDSSGNLGIGTSSPTFGTGIGLHIQNSTRPNIRMTQSSSSDGYEMFVSGTTFYAADNVGASGGTVIWRNTATRSETMRLDSSGNLGIGTNSPASLTKLTVFQDSTYAVQMMNSNQNYTLRLDAGASNALILGNRTSFTDLLTVSTSGNLGLGVTPSAWGSSYKSLQMGGRANFASGALTQPYVTYNAYHNGTSWTYVASTVATAYESGTSGEHRWYTAPSGTAGNAISFTQAMTLDSSGNLGIGTSSPQSKLNIYTTDASSKITLSDSTVGSGYGGVLYGYGVAGTGGYMEVGVLDGSAGYTKGIRVTQQANSIQFFTGTTNAGNAERMRLDSSGNLGIGTSSPGQKLDVRGNINIGDGTNNANITNTTDSAFTLISGGTSTQNNIRLYGPSHATLANTQTFLTAGTERMRLDASGNLGLGVTPSAWSSGNPAFEIKGGSLWANATSGVYFVQNAYYNGSNWVYKTSAAASYYLQGGGHKWFNSTSTQTAGTDPSFTQAMTLDASGNLLLGRTSRLANELVSLQCAGTAGSNTNGILLNYTGTPNDTTHDFLQCVDGNWATTRASIRSNGGIANYSANNVNLSDARLKRDFTPAQPWLEKICKIEVGTFFYKDQSDDEPNLGVLAQQVESVAPELVDVSGFGETPDDGVPYKAIYQTDMQYAMLKAIQEQQAIINQLKARLDAANL